MSLSAAEHKHCYDGTGEALPGSIKEPSSRKPELGLSQTGPLPAPHRAGTIAIASGHLSRYPGFTVSMLHLLRPHNTHFEWHMGLNVAANFNAGIRRMQGDWFWVMGDDHMIAPDTLIRLLDHRVDVVVPMCVRRDPPFIPVIFKRPKSDTPPGQFPPWHWSELPVRGLHEVTVAGTAGMLIRRHVLEAMTDPWFEIGQSGSDQLNEDTHFCVKLQQMGIKVYADLDTWIGHMTPCCLWPSRNAEGEWTIAIDIGGGVAAQIPPAFLAQLMKRSSEEPRGSVGSHSHKE